MREALIKKRFGVPALLLIAIILTSASVAACLIATIKFTTTAKEPLTFSKSNPLQIVYHGESGTVTVTARIASTKIGYGLFVDTTIVKGQVESVKYSGSTPPFAAESAGYDFNSDGDMVDAKYNIGPLEFYDISVTINSADDTTLGEVVVILDFIREHRF